MNAPLVRIALRLLRAAATITASVLLAFVALRFVPGGPFDTGRNIAPEARRNLEAHFGLDEPLGSQVVRFLRGLAQGDLGPSIAFRDFDVAELIAEALPVSATLAVLAFAVAVPLGVALAFGATLRSGRRLGAILDGITTALLACATFALAPMLALVFAVLFPVLPAGGWSDGNWRHLVLPVASLALPISGGVAVLVRGVLVEEIAHGHLRTARAYGFSRLGALLGTRRTVLAALVSWTAPMLALTASGAVVAETVYDLPGMGLLLAQSAGRRDYPLVVGLVLVAASLVIVLNVLADIASARLDPRGRDG